MGIPAMITLFKRTGSEWSSSTRLKETKLIIDVTDSMYWFSKKNLLEGKSVKADRFGGDLVEYGEFFRKFFETLAKASVEPIVVYNGGRLRESSFGPLASKALHLEKSSRIRMYLLEKRKGIEGQLNHDIFSDLTSVVLKQIINNLNLSNHPVQSISETYPFLRDLAEKHDCPVLTSHRDFILTPVKKGFIVAEEFMLPDPTHRRFESEIPVTIYENTKFVKYFKLNCYCQAITTLYALLRPDFSGMHFKILNNFFELPARLKFSSDDCKFRRGFRPPHQPFHDRLVYILKNWKNCPDLKIASQVKNKLRFLGGSEEMLKDYDAIFGSFNDCQFDANRTSRSVEVDFANRDCTADFFVDILEQPKNFNRGLIEDLETSRSTYSLSNPVKLYLMRQNSIPRLKVLDREYDALKFQDLCNDIISSSMDDSPKSIFHLPDSRDFSRTKICLALKGDFFNHLIVMLHLIRFGLQSLFNLESVQPKHEFEKYRPLKRKFYEAVYNVFMYYAYKNKDEMLSMEKLDNDERLISKETDDGLLAELRIAVNEIDNPNKVQRNPSISDKDYIQIKHLIEMLNSSLHAYSEINSFKNYSLGPRLDLTKYYNGVLVYKIMNYFDRKKNEASLGLLRLESSVWNLLGIE